jgi:hypothetical protein
MFWHKKKKKTPLIVKGQAGVPVYFFGQIGVGREAIFLLFLRLAFVFPGIVVGIQGFVDRVCCVGEACFIVSFS